MQESECNALCPPPPPCLRWGGRLGWWPLLPSSISRSLETDLRPAASPSRSGSVPLSSSRPRSRRSNCSVLRERTPLLLLLLWPPSLCCGGRLPSPPPPPSDSAQVTCCCCWPTDMLLLHCCCWITCLCGGFRPGVSGSWLLHCLGTTGDRPGVGGGAGSGSLEAGGAEHTSHTQIWYGVESGGLRGPRVGVKRGGGGLKGFQQAFYPTVMLIEGPKCCAALFNPVRSHPRKLTSVFKPQMYSIWYLGAKTRTPVFLVFIAPYVYLCT
jgi:hypothetical protein